MGSVLHGRTRADSFTQDAGEEPGQGCGEQGAHGVAEEGGGEEGGPEAEGDGREEAEGALPGAVPPPVHAAHEAGPEVPAPHGAGDEEERRYSLIRYPLTTESAMKKIEDTNTLVFIVDTRANKVQIKEAVRKMYDVKAVKVNTLIRPDGKKKAMVRLPADHDALDVVNKIGIL